MTPTTMQRAREALRLADDQPQRSAALAAAVARAALAEGDPAAAAVAQRARGLASIHVMDLDTAIRHLRAAIRLARRAGSTVLAAEARMTLAFALNRRGQPVQALTAINTALSDLDGLERARAQAQRGAILHQLGRLDDALESYRAALPTLRRASDHLWTLRLLNNRGVLHSHRGEFAAAETDLTEAERLSSQLGLGLWVAFTHQNLGWVHSLRGDIPVALHYLDLAEARMIELGSQVGSVLSDRAELLLSVRLVSEARAAASRAVEEFEREARRIALPEVRLLLAQATTLDGNPMAALRYAQHALREFSAQHRHEWATFARFVVLTCQAAGTGRPAVALAQVERAADDLVSTRRPVTALEARLLAAQLALERGHAARGVRQLRQAGQARRRRSAAMRARAWYAEALLRHALGNRRGAITAVRAGLRILDEHRATLGTTDLRAHASGRRIELAELGLRIAFEDGRPGQILAWAEQGRASHLLLPPVHPPDDPELADLLAQLRSTVSEIERVGPARPNRAGLVQRQAVLESEIRDYCRRQPSEAPGRTADPVPVPELIATLNDMALLEFIQLDNRLHVASVVDGRVRITRLVEAAAVRDLVGRVPFALQRLAGDRASTASRRAAADLLRYAGQQLDSMLLRPLAQHIADRPLILVPTGSLQSLPWSILPSCIGRAVTVSPSGTLWYTANRRAPTTTGRVAVVAGPGLPGAQEEARRVAASYGATAHLGQDATVASVLTALNEASVVHLAAHGRVNADNPLFSSLRFADGPFTVYDLEGLDRVAALVVLAACESGRTVALAGDELLGLSAAFLTHGATQIVASVVPVPDAESAPLMMEFHRLLLAGQPSPAALAQAQQQLVSGTSAETAAAAGFVCIGAGFTFPAARPDAD